ncbi:MAG: hypothetical protein N4A35_04245 [Flavobacteriales bacterium]|jgi:hypothetical protein|nr:hypothetical protein [Flavobacteriales bacterium]
MESSIQNIELNDNGRKVKGKKVIVRSIIDSPIKNVWEKLLQSQTLEYVARGVMKFRPLKGKFPKIWKVHTIVQTKVLLFHFIPIGGVHSIAFEKIDVTAYQIQTVERNRSAKIWNHTMELTAVSQQQTSYKDEIDVYCGFLTPIMARGVLLLYQYRRRRWKKMLKMIKT